MMPRVIRAGEQQGSSGGYDGGVAASTEANRAGGARNIDDGDLDDRSRHQYLVVLQFLHSQGLLETACAMESEVGVAYQDGCLPEGCILEASLDMFGQYRREGVNGVSTGPSLEEKLLQIESGVCCTERNDKSGDEPATFSSNVTAVCWAVARCNETLAVVATADRCLRVVDVTGKVVSELAGLTSPVLCLDAAPPTTADVEAALLSACAKVVGEEDGGDSADRAGAAATAPGLLVLATAMGGEVLLLRLQKDLLSASGYSFEKVQQFNDHKTRASEGRFAPVTIEGAPTAHLVTISKDRRALLYRRNSENSSEFALAGEAAFPGEVTCCCWASPTSFALGIRDDHRLHYWNVDGGGADGKAPCERSTTNLNALGDSIVSFTVLALACSPDRDLIAVCTDKSRVIVLPTFGHQQLRNLYGATIDQYDVPSVCFSLDRTFVYTTSSLPMKSVPELPNVEPVCGEVAVFELRTGNLVLKLSCHSKPVRCLQRHPFSEMLVSGSFDKTVRFWS